MDKKDKKFAELCREKEGKTFKTQDNKLVCSEVDEEQAKQIAEGMNYKIVSEDEFKERMRDE